MSSSLRRAVDAVGIIAMIGIIAVGGLFGSRHYRRQQELKQVGQALHEFERILALKAAGKQVEITQGGWPTTVEPDWFRAAPPRNPLLTPDRPWVEIASPEEAELLDPPVRMAAQRSVASFWYNPYRGVVRARVPLLASEQASVELYNAANGRSVGAVFEPLVVQEPPPAAEKPPEPPKKPAMPKVRVSGAPRDPD